ncbi:hypothetical protein FFLO_04193 [Filobasidium floriforme]|uniref:Uncharacterized protein n=1 Tax=Filobasidium floriforme TaxID=5210 RepID=A0A8K0JPP3_9TREE|nr:hypothetical protein FFLO_04193 [Filobasidium floriforme]
MIQNEEAKDDEDRAPAGAKGSKKLEVETGSRRGRPGGRYAVKQPYLSMDQVAKHNLSNDAWVVIDGNVWDVSDFLPHHPGGSRIVLANAGKDATEIYKELHPPNTIENNLSPKYFKGRIDPELAKEASYEAEMKRIQDAREALPAVETILGLQEMEDAAKAVLSTKSTAYYETGALDHVTLKENSKTFRKCRLVPRVMRDVGTTSTTTKVFGLPSALPIYISPASNALLGHPDAEFNIVRGAARTGIVQGVSAASSLPLNELLDEKHNMDEEIEEGKWGRGLVDRALLLTVDSNVLGHRQTNEKLKGTTGDAQPGIRAEPNTEWPAYHDARLNWDDLDWLKGLAKGTPIYLKGVCSAEDVQLAKEHGLAGVILSNHGGRQLDYARTGFDSLRSLHQTKPDLLRDPKFDVYIDGGVKRGSDVLMALALGARGVGLGRAFLWAQTAYGEKGVVRTIRIMESEIIMAMRLLGVNKISELKPENIECLQEVWR